MFEALVYVYENYWQGDACPELPVLARRLKAVGFDDDDIQAALVWLDGLNTATQRTQIYPPQHSGLAKIGAPRRDTVQGPARAEAPHEVQPQSQVRPHMPSSMRAYSPAEQEHLGSQALGYISFLESSGALAPKMGEIVIDRAMAAPGNPVDVDDLKIIILMVYWSFGKQPDALVLDELCDDAANRIGH